MSPQELIDLVAQLSPEEQDMLREYIFLQGRKGTPFFAAVEEFIAAHPELFRRLAQ